jgi:exonuclease VII small subunit
MAEQPPDDIRFEDGMAALEALVRARVGRALARRRVGAFEQGVALVRMLNERLAAVEQRIERLVRATMDAASASSRRRGRVRGIERYLERERCASMPLWPCVPVVAAPPIASSSHALQLLRGGKRIRPAWCSPPATPSAGRARAPCRTPVRSR